MKITPQLREAIHHAVIERQVGEDDGILVFKNVFGDELPTASRLEIPVSAEQIKDLKTGSVDTRGTVVHLEADVTKALALLDQASEQN